MTDQPARHGRLIALSSAAILAVYTAGYLRTRPAADRIALIESQRRTVAPAAVTAQLPAAGLEAVNPQIRGEGPASVARTPAARSIQPTPPGDAAPVDVVPEPAAPVDTPPVEPAEPVVEAVPLPEPAAPVAEAPPPEPAPPPIVQQGEYRDGTYFGWGYSRHGNIQAAVVVEGGRMVSAEISQCRTRYSCSVVDRLPQQVLSRQRAKVDLVSGATESTYAYEDAVAEALAKAR